MVQAIAGNIFDSHAQTLVNAVNCTGVMGKGIALEIRKRFPAMYQDYGELYAPAGVTTIELAAMFPR
jgi:O-acetyl-ADP-ribose deacetylase (regulator of RNase III)